MIENVNRLERSNRARMNALDGLQNLYREEPSPVKTEFVDNVTEWTEGTEEVSPSSFAVEKPVDKTSAELTERTEGICAAVDETPFPPPFALCPVCDVALEPLPFSTDLWEPVRNQTHNRVMRRHASFHHPQEPLWNALPVLDLQAPSQRSKRGAKTPTTRQADPRRKKGDDGTAVPTRAKNNVASVAGLVGYALRKAAVSLPLRKQADWYGEWGHVRDLICARIGGAVHTVCGNYKPYFKNRTRVQYPEGDEGLQHEGMTVQFRWVKTEAHRYLCALMEKVVYSIEPDEWTTYQNARRMNLIQVFFHNGVNHHTVGLITTEHIPPSPHFPAH